MTNNDNQAVPSTMTNKTHFRVALRWFSTALILALVMTFGPIQVVGSDEQYVQIYGLIEQADSLSGSGQIDLAKTKYQEAQNALLNLKKNSPNWNVKVVAYRLKYVTEKLAALSPTTPTAAGDIKVATLPSNVQVQLLDAGAEPRKTLRVQAKAGEKQTMGMTLKSAMGMGVGGAPAQSMKMPAIQITVSALPKNVAAEGDISYELLIEDVAVVDEPGSIPQIAEAMKASFGTVKGLTMLCIMSDRGLSKKAEPQIPSGADSATRQSMEQMKESFSTTGVLWPQEAVGLGAKWEVKQKIKSQGMMIDQTTTHELVSIEGDIVTTKSSTTQTAAKQKIAIPAMPQMKADLTQLVGSGKGDMTSDLTKLLPTQVTVDDHTELTMEMNAGGQKQTMAMKTDTNIRLEAK